MGRQHHLAQVYRNNINAALSFGNIEFVLLDYHSPDDLGAWVHAEFADWLATGLLRYCRTTEPVTFHMAHAKNVAHRLASGDVLINLDADNAFEAGFAEEVASLFADDARAIVKFHGYHAGCSGRIALRRDDFYRLGGYDEELVGWGYEDQDMIARAKRVGLAIRHFSKEHALAIQHHDSERLRFYADKRKGNSNAQNRATSHRKVEEGRVVANEGRPWGLVRLEPDTLNH